jgi:integrase
VRVRVPSGRITKVVDTEAEAVALRAALVVERGVMAERGELAPAKEEGNPGAGLTVSEWASRWFERREAQELVRWTRVDRGRWRLYVEGTPLAKVRLGMLRTRDVRAWLDGMLARRSKSGGPLKTQTLRNAFNLVRKCLGNATAAEVLGANPAASVKVPTRGLQQRDVDYLHPQEVEAVLTCDAIPESARLLYTVAIFTGLREGELWALRWGDVRT